MADNVEGTANLAKVLLQFANSGKLVEAASALEKAASAAFSSVSQLVEHDHQKQRQDRQDCPHKSAPKIRSTSIPVTKSEKDKAVQMFSVYYYYCN